MLFTTIRDVLVGASAVTAIVGAGTNARIDSGIRPQAISTPSVLVQTVSVTPVNSLDKWCGLDGNSVQIDSFAATDTQAHELSAACRSAMQSAGYAMDSEFDNFEPDSEIAGLFRVTQTYSVWS